MPPGDTARLYHALTAYRPGQDWPVAPPDHPLVLRDFVPNDLERWPAPCKAYPHALPAVELPREWARDPTPATAVLAGAPAAPARLDLAGLARVLYLSAGVVRIGERPDKPANVFRAAGSAG